MLAKMKAKHPLFSLVSVLVLGFASCTEVPVNTEEIVRHKVTDEYAANFVAKYGKPAANQSWDFTQNNLPKEPEAQTRVQSSVAVVTDTKTDVNGTTVSALAQVTTIDEFEDVMSVADELPVLDWDDEEAYGILDMYPWWIHYNEYFEGYKNAFSQRIDYALGYAYFKEDGTPLWASGPFMGQMSALNIVYETAWAAYDKKYTVQVYNGEKYYSQYPITSWTGQRCDASQFKGKKDFYWFTSFGQNEFNMCFVETTVWDEKCRVCGEYVWPEDDQGNTLCPICWANGMTSSVRRSSTGYAINEEYKAAHELKYYKECITPLGAKYWLFDIDHDDDGDYKDVVFLIEPVTMKRYIIEDLGALDDFDFNDIVVDVTDYWDVEKGRTQKAIVRALGGTLDFTITIGSTTWTKSEHYEAFTPYRANDGSYTNTKLAELDKLCEFEVEGWDPSQNNISVTVKLKDESQSASGGATVTIPFPKAGDVPMIIAVDPTFYFQDSETQANYSWMPERVSIPASYFTVTEATEPTEP